MGYQVRRVPRRIVVLTICALVLALALITNLSPWLRGGYGWRWPYDPPKLLRAIPLIAAVCVYVAGSWLLLRRTSRSTSLLVWSMAGAAFIPLMVIFQRSDNVIYELFARTVSPLTTGPHHAAAHIQWNLETLRAWPDTMDYLQTISNRHAALSPPGLPLWYHLLNTLLDRVPGLADPLRGALLPYQCQNYDLLTYSAGTWASAWFGMLMPVWAALTVFPLHSLTARLVDQTTARRVILWWPLVPGLLMFAPTWNTLYPLFSLIAFVLLVRSTDQPPSSPQRAIYLIVSGLTAGLLAFANISMIPLWALFGVYTLLLYLLREQQALRWTWPVMTGIWFGLGLLIPWGLYGLLTGANPADVVRHAMSSHLDLNRPYFPWLGFHLWEWALFSGMPLVVLWLTSALRGWRRSGQDCSLLGIALVITLIALDLSGTARGETGRVWLFFTPFMLIAAGDTLRHLAPRSGDDSDYSWLVVTIGQVALLLALAITWNVIGTELTPPPAAPGDLETAHPTRAVFADRLRLVGWDAAVEADAATGGRAVVLRLDWQSIERPTRAFWFSALLISPDDTPLPEAVVWQPLDTHYPVTCWAAGASVGDHVTLPLPDGAAAGDWWISLSVLDDAAHAYQPLAVTGTSDTQIGLGPVSVP